VLLKAGADPNAPSISSKSTPLHIAAELNQGSVVTVLLHGKAQVACKDITGATALHRAAKGCSASEAASALKILLRNPWNRADPNARDLQHRAPLHWAARQAHADAARVLVEARADVYLEDKNGDSPLNFAFQRHYAEVALALVDGIALRGSPLVLSNASLRLAASAGTAESAVCSLRDIPMTAVCAR
jgi:ankyrin repeat protein